MDNEVERFPSLVEDLGHWYGKDVCGRFEWSHHALGLGDKVQEFEDVFQGLLGDLIWIDLPDLSQGYRGGERPDLILA